MMYILSNLFWQNHHKIKIENNPLTSLSWNQIAVNWNLDSKRALIKGNRITLLWKNLSQNINGLFWTGITNKNDERY